MGFVKEFKEFAMKGNVVDLAVGVIIGGAFGKIVTALVDDIIMPPISLVIGDKGFINYYIPIGTEVRKMVANNPGLSLEEAKKSGAVLAWGDFITVIINFVILALIIFLMIKAMNAAKRKDEAVAPPPPAPEISSTDKLLIEIRDSLKK